MSKDVNQCNFTGRLGKDPESKFMPNGNAVVNFSIACGDDYKAKSGEKVERTNWVNMVAFGKLAEIIGQYLGKGSRIYASGKLQTRKWQDNEGNDRYATEIIVSEMVMLDSKGDNAAQQNQGKRSNQNAAPQQSVQQDALKMDEFDDAIPF